MALVLTNAAFNDLLDLRVIHFIKTGWFYALQKINWESNYLNKGIFFYYYYTTNLLYILTLSVSIIWANLRSAVALRDTHTCDFAIDLSSILAL